MDVSIKGVSADSFNVPLTLVKQTSIDYTDKKENQIFLIYREIQNGAVAKSYMTNCLLVKFDFLIYQFIV
jgi:hypothetical protein